MKKLYMLIMVALIAATANAQVVKMEVGANQDRQLPIKGIVKADKSAPAEGWLFYQDYLESYFGETCNDGTLSSILSARLTISNPTSSSMHL